MKGHANIHNGLDFLLRDMLVIMVRETMLKISIVAPTQLIIYWEDLSTVLIALG